MVVLATCATVIASQAVITGAYSLIHQAIQLGLLPRLAILHTSEAHFGQIYIPRVNALLLDRRAAAGADVPHVERARPCLRHRGHHHDGGRRAARLHRDLEAVEWKWWSAALLIVPLVVIDATFLQRQPAQAVRGRLAAAAVRRRHGAADHHLAARHAASSIQKTRRIEVPLESLLRSLEKKPPHVVPGTAVFLTSDPEFAPTALMHNLKHNKVLHEHNVILTIVTADTPRVPEDERVTITPVSPHFTRVALQVRLHGIAECAEGARHRPQAGLAVRHHVDVVLPVAPLAQAGGAFRHAALAGSAVHRACPLAPATRPTSSRFRPAAWSKSARRSPCERHRLNVRISCYI